MMIRKSLNNYLSDYDYDNIKVNPKLRAENLTFHSNAGVLRCHYCGYEEYKKSQCNACGSLDVSTKGFGTEQLLQ